MHLWHATHATSSILFPPSSCIFFLLLAPLSCAGPSAHCFPAFFTEAAAFYAASTAAMTTSSAVTLKLISVQMSLELKV